MPMTCVFSMDAEDYAANPFKAETPFGQPVIVSKGDVCAERDRLHEALEDVVDTLEAMDLHIDNPLYDRVRAVIEQS
jgi:hypothetical protein